MKFRLETVDADHMAGVYEANHDDLRAVADHCANMRAIGATGTKDVKVAASVPGIFIMQYCNNNGITFAEFMRDPKHAERFLADPALKAFRIWEGRL